MRANWDEYTSRHIFGTSATWREANIEAYREASEEDDVDVYRLARVTCEECIPEGYDEDMQESGPHDRDVS